MEELVAEIGAAFLAADLNITPEVRENHAAYIGSWLKVLKDDKKAVFTAAAHAQRAAELLHSLQPNNPELEVKAEKPSNFIKPLQFCMLSYHDERSWLKTGWVKFDPKVGQSGAFHLF